MEEIKNLLRKLAEGKLSVEEVWQRLKSLPFKNLEFSCLDTHRIIRRGFPEVIFAEGKEENQIIEIIQALREDNQPVFVTRMREGTYKKIKERFPQARYYKKARIMVLGIAPPPGKGKVLVISAGTSDIPVAEEARVTAEYMGARVEKIYDVGVAGVHRVLYQREKLQSARVLVVVAGMEGALPSLVGGLVDKPVIAVPTSTGYGASFQGLSALLGMLNSCVPGIAVVNIDNGFGAGYLAGMINSLGEK